MVANCFRASRPLPSGVVINFVLNFSTRIATPSKIMSFIRLAAHNLVRSRLALAIPRIQNPIPWRASFSASAGLTKDVIETRVLDVLKGFEKVNQSKVWTKLFAELLVTHILSQ